MTTGNPRYVASGACSSRGARSTPALGGPRTRGARPHAAGAASSAMPAIANLRTQSRGGGSTEKPFKSLESPHPLGPLGVSLRRGHADDLGERLLARWIGAEVIAPFSVERPK